MYHSKYLDYSCPYFVSTSKVIFFKVPYSNKVKHSNKSRLPNSIYNTNQRGMLEYTLKFKPFICYLYDSIVRKTEIEYFWH